MEEDKFVCQNCGKEDCGILFTSKKILRRSNDEAFFVCEDCFKKIEGISFEDYRLNTLEEL